MQDFIGQDIVVDGWVATSGKGNGPAEYGMILFLVDAVTPKLKLRRLQVSYDGRGKPTATVVTITSSNPNKYVVVEPPHSVMALFMRVAQCLTLPEDHKKVGLWLHGQKALTWL